VNAVPAARAGETPHRRVSWTPLIVIATGQMLLVFNVTALKVSIAAIIDTFEASASKVKTAIVVYSLVVAALILLGSRLRERFGARKVFQATLLLFAAAMALMATCQGPLAMIVAQALAGAGSAAMVPTLVVMVANHYSGERRGLALGWLAATQAIGIVPSLLIAGLLAERLGWRYTFAMLALAALGSWLLCRFLRPDPPESSVGVDKVGLALASVAIFLIGLGCNNLLEWGPWRATVHAPIQFMSLSPAPVAIVSGVLLVKGFFVWSHWFESSGGTPLIALDVFRSEAERSVLTSIFLIGLLGAAVTYIIPLYIEIVQGRSSLHTAVAVIPFALGSFAAAILVVPLGMRIHPARIARYAFLTMAAGAGMLGATIQNDWSDSAVIASMVAAGLAEGALATLLFRLLASRKKASDVGTLCGTTDYLAAGIGTSLASALVIGLLASSVQREFLTNPLVADELRSQIDLNRATFVSNDRLRTTLARRGVSPAQLDKAVRINTDARLHALKVCFFVLSGLALIALIPSAALPPYQQARSDAQ
jgi:MFS family permease